MLRLVQLFLKFKNKVGFKFHLGIHLHVRYFSVTFHNQSRVALSVIRAGWFSLTVSYFQARRSGA